MHPFDSVLSGMRLESSLFVRLRGHAPWSISFDSGAQARLVVVARGRVGSRRSDMSLLSCRQATA